MTKKLLVADDSITIHKVVGLTFADEDFVIEAVANGDQAIEKARSMQPDIVLADVFMPGRSGYEVCAAIKADQQLSEIPVVLLVGTFEPFDEAEASRVKCDGFLTKPFDTSELIQVVHSLVGQTGEKFKPDRPASEEEVQRGEGPAKVAPSTAQPRKLVSQRTRESFLGSKRILDLFDPAMIRQAMARARAQSVPVAGKVIHEGNAVRAEQPAPAAESIPRPFAAPQVIPFPGTLPGDTAASQGELSEETLNRIVEKLVKRIAPDAIRDVAWEVVPELAEIIIRQTLDQQNLSHKS